MSGDFYLLGVSASSGLPSSLLSEPEVADSPILCLTTAKLSAFAGLHNIPLHSQKRSWSWYQRLLMHVGGGRRPICLQRRAPIVSRALPSAGMPPRRSRPGNCRIRKARGGWWGMVAASSVRPLAFSRAPKTVQGRRTPLTLLHSGVKPAWIPLLVFVHIRSPPPRPKYDPQHVVVENITDYQKKTKHIEHYWRSWYVLGIIIWLW